MKKISIIILLLFTTIYGSGKNDNFEKKLNNFRFSLNEVLEKYDDEKINDLKFDKNDKIVLLINRFTSENENEIKKYREKLLKEYENNPDFKFNIKDYKQADLNEINANLENFNITEKVPLSKLLWINPISEISVFKTTYISQKKGLVQLAVFITKNNITSSQIKTRKINKSQWEIIDNSYDFVFKFIYDLEKGKVTNIEIFEKK